jgi:hypothetical protein
LTDPSRRAGIDVKREQEHADLAKPVLELLHGIDFAFDQKSGEPTTPQTEQVRYATALAAIGRFLMKIDPTDADRFFVLSDALADHSIGAHAPVLSTLKRRSAPNPTKRPRQTLLLPLDVLIALGEHPKMRPIAVLSGRPHRYRAVPHAHCANTSDESLAIHATPVADEILRDGSPAVSFSQLQSNPLGVDHRPRASTDSCGWPARIRFPVGTTSSSARFGAASPT